jgi:mercuric ion transport protein
MERKSASGILIGAVAARSGLTVDTIRFYEKQGLIAKPHRTEGGFRLYSGEDLDRLSFVSRAQALGFSLIEIRELLLLRDRYEFGDLLACARPARSETPRHSTEGFGIAKVGEAIESREEPVRSGGMQRKLPRGRRDRAQTLGDSMKVEVLYVADCPNHKPAVERARDALRAVGMPDTVQEVEIRTKREAEAQCFLGSPTVRVNGRDVELEARAVVHFGVGCRSYVENGERSGLPSRELIAQALQELPAAALGPAQSASQEKRGTEFRMLVAGGLAAVLASSCCLGPLILVTLGFSGAWIGSLAALEPYRPWFIGSAVIALFFAGRRIFRPAAACNPGEVCALPAIRRAYKVVFGFVTGLVAVALVYPYLAHFFY